MPRAETRAIRPREVSEGEGAAYDVAAGDAEGGERGGEAEASAVRLGPGEDGVVVDDGGAVAEHGRRAVQEAQRRERARVGRVRAEPVHAAGAGGGLACVCGTASGVNDPEPVEWLRRRVSETRRQAELVSSDLAFYEDGQTAEVVSR